MLFSRGLREIVLVVKDVEASARFYGEVVGLELVEPVTPEWAWFYAGDPARRQRIGIHRGALLFEKQPATPRGERWGPIHYALLVARVELEAAAERVRSRGVEVFGPHSFDDVARAYYFYDPDENLVEFYAYNDA